MASSTPNPWGGGRINWALEAEREDEERAAAEAAAAAAVESQSFPSLKEAAKTKKKKKRSTYTLSEIATGTYVGPGGARYSSSSSSSPFEPKGLTADELMRLPTGPKERSPEELEHDRLGGGFRTYGASSRAPGPPRRSDDEATTWGAGGGRRPYGSGFDDDSRRAPPPRASDLDLLPSRADEDDNWAAGKRAVPAMEPARRGPRDRYQDLGGELGTARADEVDNWSVGKRLIPARSSGFGFRDPAAGAGADSDRWVRGGGSVHNGAHERPRLVLDPPRRDGGGGEKSSAATEPAKTRPSPFGAARPREEVLAEKGVDWKKVDLEMEASRTARPGSSQSSRPSSANSADFSSGPVELKLRPKVNPFGDTKPREVLLEEKRMDWGKIDMEPAHRATDRPKVNPFGDAKPREVLLEEKGMDWRKIDMELAHRAVDRPESEHEKLLKEEIEHLKKELNKASEGKPDAESTEYAAGQLASLQEQVLLRERELEQLIHDLDDKVRFGQKALGEKRPGSGGSRSGSIAERPPSRSSLTEESRSTDFMERPRSRGSTGDMWSRSDERRGFHVGREGGFFGIRDVDRPRSRDRW